MWLNNALEKIWLHKLGCDSQFLNSQLLLTSVDKGDVWHSRDQKADRMLFKKYTDEHVPREERATAKPSNDHKENLLPTDRKVVTSFTYSDVCQLASVYYPASVTAV